MNNKLFKTVNELLEKYIGGQIFFTEIKEDNVDSIYRYYDNYDVLGQLIV